MEMDGELFVQGKRTVECHIGTFRSGEFVIETKDFIIWRVAEFLVCDIREVCGIAERKRAATDLL